MISRWTGALNAIIVHIPILSSWYASCRTLTCLLYRHASADLLFISCSTKLCCDHVTHRSETWGTGSYFKLRGKFCSLVLILICQKPLYVQLDIVGNNTVILLFQKEQHVQACGSCKHITRFVANTPRIAFLSLHLLVTKRCLQRSCP